MPRPRRAAAIALAGLGALVILSCSHDSYLKVILQSDGGMFQNVTEVDVSIQREDGTSPTWLTYIASTPLSFDMTTQKTLSIAFTPAQSGTVKLKVGVLSDTVCLGSGTTTATIKKGDVSAVTVRITPGTTCPTASDGGSAITDAATDAVTFPGCNPASSATTCAANQTCFVSCTDQPNMCVPAGTKGPGEPCVTNNDCKPGTQCFDYTGIAGCSNGPKICQKFCSDDAQCATGGGGVAIATGGVTGSGGGAGGGGAGGGAGRGGQSGQTGGRGGQSGGAGSTTTAAGTGGAAAPAASGASSCRNPVVCGAGVTTSYRTCSFACDPRGDAKLGCPTGLLCFLYRDSASGQDAPDCGCSPPTRTGLDGAACTSSASCAPGHICNLMGNTQLCRKLCKMSSPEDCVAPHVCGPLQNNSVFGVCVGG